MDCEKVTELKMKLKFKLLFFLITPKLSRTKCFMNTEEGAKISIQNTESTEYYFGEILQRPTKFDFAN